MGMALADYSMFNNAAAEVTDALASFGANEPKILALLGKPAIHVPCFAE